MLPAMADPNERTATTDVFERGRPLYFAGRHAEMSRLARYLRALRSTGDATMGMVLIDGVQGIGKTQLALEFARRQCAADQRILHLACGVDALAGDADEVVDALTKGLPKRDASDANLIDFARCNVKALPFRIQLRERDRTFAQLLDTTRQRGWWDGHALILTIDEIQTIEPAPRALLKVLHEGFHGCPIMVIGMGLQHAQEVLSTKAVGKDGAEHKGAISRFGLRLTLDALSEDEAAEAVERGVESTGPGTVPTALAKRIGAEAKGFPQHLHGYIQAVVDALAEGRDLQPASIQARILSAGGDARTDFYRSRLQSVNRRYRVGILHLATALRGGPLAFHEAIKAIDDLGAPDVAGAAVVSEAIEKGVLRHQDDDTLAFPIPSFHGYMVQLAESSRVA